MRGRPRVPDRLRADQADDVGDLLTATGQFVGTAQYMAPEQIMGEAVDGRADVYALGCILYHCLTGAPPFERDNSVAVIYAHLNDPPPAASAVRPELPAAIDAVIARAMAKSPDDRYSTGAELAAAARAALEPGEAAAPSRAAARRDARDRRPPRLRPPRAGASPPRLRPPAVARPPPALARRLGLLSRRRRSPSSAVVVAIVALGGARRWRRGRRDRRAAASRGRAGAAGSQAAEAVRRAGGRATGRPISRSTSSTPRCG